MTAVAGEPELRAWLGLLLVPKLGPVKARRLLTALGSPQAVLAAAPSAWSDVLGQRWLPDACRPAPLWDEQCRLTFDWLAGGSVSGDHAPVPRTVLTLADARYPWALLQAADPPLLLFAQGCVDLLQRPALAIVGSRHATPAGSENARAFAQAISAAGVTVVSGLAEGIDAAAHGGALAAGRSPVPGQPAQLSQELGSTIAVVGTGLDVVYPAGHQALAQQVAAQGLMLSEFMLGTPPRAANFPKRNRVVAGISLGTLVVEAALQSGSLITARLAVDMGREVFAIPGSIHSPHSRGCHSLIKQGAKLVETAQDILDEIWPVMASRPEAVAQADMPLFEPTDSPTEDPVLRAMGFDPISQEALSVRTGMGPAALGAHLLALEMAGQVARLPGLRFQRQAQA